MKEVVIITRRFKREHYVGAGVGDKENRYESHPINENFLLFWAKSFVENPRLEGKLNPVYLKLFQELKGDLTRDALKKIFDELDEQCIDKIGNTKYLTKIQEFLIDGKTTHIFIYHHWPDKQGFKNTETQKKEFLTALRQNIVEIENNGDLHVNWLIHDTDILSSSYNDIFYMDSKSYHPNITDEAMTKLIPDSLKGDNIWCFIHEPNRTGFFKDIILDFHNKDWTADSLYAELRLDKAGCLRRLQMLNLKDTDTLETEMLLFILQKSPGVLGINQHILVSELKVMIEK
jgi:hypothetical protein